MQFVDVAVVGGGMAGLIAAHDTSSINLATVLFEAEPTLGGRAQTRVREGCHFNQGPHALYADGHLPKTLKALGVNISGTRVQLSNAIALWGKQRHPLPISLETMPGATPLDDLDRAN